MNLKTRLFALALIGYAGWALSPPLSAEAERMPVETGSSFVALAIDPQNPDRVFAATERTLYESRDAGRNWQERFRSPGSARIRKIALAPSLPTTLLVATDQGLYGSFDGGAQWSRVFRGADEQEADATHVAFHPAQPSLAALGTHGGLFISRDEGRSWKAAEIPQSARSIISLSFDPHDPDRVYLLSLEGLFTGSISRGQWRQLLGFIGAEEQGAEEPAPLDELETDEESGSLRRLSAIAAHPSTPSLFYIGGKEELKRSSDGGLTWRALPRTGLDSSDLFELLVSPQAPHNLYAATERGVAFYEPGHERWFHLTQGQALTRVQDLAIGGRWLWIAAKEGLHRFDWSSYPKPQEELSWVDRLLERFSDEPTIVEVREAAIRYAEVHPDKIKRWRRQASLKALFPSVDFGYDRDVNRFITSRGSTNDPATDRMIMAKDPSRSFDVSLSWDLGELIWNSDQTSIDVRSKLMVQLREDIVDEVTRLYFERRRLQAVPQSGLPDKDPKRLERELRIQELTALIDGLTGGFFSQGMKTRSR